MGIKQSIKDFYAKKKDFIWLFVILIVAYYVISGPGVTQQYSRAESLAYDSYDYATNSKMAGGSYAVSEMAAPSIAPYPDYDNQGYYPEEPQKIRKNGWISTEVERTDYEDSKKTMKSIVEGYGGFFTSENENKYRDGEIDYLSYSASMKVPVDKFDAVMDQLTKIGELQNMNVNADDMTTQYHDLKAEKESLIKLKQRTEQLLAKAELISDIINIEEKLANYQSRIENIDRQLSNIDRQTDYSMISISITEKRNVPGAIAEMTGLKELARNAVRSFDGLFVAVSNWFAYLLVILVGYGIYKGYKRLTE